VVGVKAVESDDAFRVNNNPGRPTAGVKSPAHGIIGVNPDHVRAAVVPQIIQGRPLVFTAGNLQVIDTPR
jgi:hypothetical protein